MTFIVIPLDSMERRQDVTTCRSYWVGTEYTALETDTADSVKRLV